MLVPHRLHLLLVKETGSTPSDDIQVCVCVCGVCVCVCVRACVRACVCVCTVYIAAYIDLAKHTWSVMYSDYSCICAIQCCTGRNGRSSVIS